jgi:hypothetical protein
MPFINHPIRAPGELPGPDDPTPAEIAERCEAIRRGWSRDEHVRRSTHRAGSKYQAVEDRRWTPPLVSVTANVAAALDVL